MKKVTTTVTRAKRFGAVQKSILNHLHHVSNVTPKSRIAQHGCSYNYISYHLAIGEGVDPTAVSRAIRSLISDGYVIMSAVDHTFKLPNGKFLKGSLCDKWASTQKALCLTVEGEELMDG